MVDLRHYLPKPETPVLVAGVFRTPDGRLQLRLENGVSWDLSESETAQWTETVQSLYVAHLTQQK